MSDEEKPNTDDSRLKMSKNVTLAVRLNGTNFPIWQKLMRIAIIGRRANRHIIGIPPPPEPGAKGYTEWEEADMIVFSWILDNIDTDIVVDFAHHHTAQALWESLSVTFESASDPYLHYDLEEKAGKIVQGEQGLETYWRHLHGIWIEIDRCQKCPIDCWDKGVGQFRKHGGIKRLFKFLTGLNDKYDGIRRDILKENPLPSAEAAYGWVKREATRLKINAPAASSDSPTGATNDGSSSGGVGLGFSARNQTHQRYNQPPPSRAPATNYRFKPDKSQLRCDHCGKSKHTRETCFFLVGFPEWWDENKKAKARLAVGVSENGGGLFPVGEGNREATSTRGRAGDHEPSTSGNRHGEAAGLIGEAAFAEKKWSSGAYGGYQDEEDNWVWH